MKTASLVLGIIGGVLAIIIGIIYIVSGVAANALVGSVDQLGDTLQAVGDQLEAEGWTSEGDVDLSGLDNLDNAYNATVGAALTTVYIFGALGIVGGILGIIGGAKAKKKGVLAGVLLIIAAITGFLVAFGFLASILFIIAAILAFIPDKSAPAAA